jgi:hypothetical protein
MDEDVVRFRRGAVRENRGRRGLSRRYSQELQRQAVAYWRIRKVAGDALPDVAQALGVAPWNLRRWADDPRVRPVQVVPDAAPVRAGLVVVLGAESLRVEGLDLQAVVELLARLR